MAKRRNPVLPVYEAATFSYEDQAWRGAPAITGSTLQNSRGGRNRQNLENLNFESLVQKGENPLNFTAQTPNGTAKSGDYQSGWNQDIPYGPMPQVPRAGAWRGNRSGE